ncbi:MAG: serine hydrolase domain-containing protein [Bacteroidota bacterium]
MRNRLLFVFSLLLTMSTSGQAQTAALDSLVQAYADQYNLPSLVLGLSINGERTFVGVGESNGAAPDLHTIYEIGSITKVVTALALADAVGRGEVTLDTPVRGLLPEGAMVAQHESGPILLRHLTTHTSGLPRIPMEMTLTEDFDMADPYARYDTDALYQTLSTPRAEAAPDARVAYSNLAVGLLGHALAHQAGTTYADLVATRILGPLGMMDTFVEIPDGLDVRFATPHDAAGDPTPPWTLLDATAGAGALRSTASDLLTLGEAALDSSSVLADAFALSMVPRADAGSGQEVGLGWFLQSVPGQEDQTLIFHSGGTGGSRSTLAVIPESGIVVSALTNRSVAAGVDGLLISVLMQLAAQG